MANGPSKCTCILSNVNNIKKINVCGGEDKRMGGYEPMSGEWEGA